MRLVLPLTCLLRRGERRLPLCGPPSPEVSQATASLCVFCLPLSFLLRPSSGLSGPCLFRPYTIKPLLTQPNLILTATQSGSSLNGLSVMHEDPQMSCLEITKKRHSFSGLNGSQCLSIFYTRGWSHFRLSLFVLCYLECGLQSEGFSGMFRFPHDLFRWTLQHGR